MFHSVRKTERKCNERKKKIYRWRDYFKEKKIWVRKEMLEMKITGWRKEIKTNIYSGRKYVNEKKEVNIKNENYWVKERKNRKKVKERKNK